MDHFYRKTHFIGIAWKRDGNTLAAMRANGQSESEIERQLGSCLLIEKFCGAPHKSHTHTKTQLRFGCRQRRQVFIV